MKIKSLIQTCSACPTQYNGETDDGKYVYIRYRFGKLSMEIDHKVIYVGYIGDALDGCISLDKIKELTKDLNIEWPETLDGWKDDDDEMI